MILRIKYLRLSISTCKIYPYIIWRFACRSCITTIRNCQFAYQISILYRLKLFYSSIYLSSLYIVGYHILFPNSIFGYNSIYTYIWKHPCLSELTPIISNTGLTHLGLEASIYEGFVLK